MSLLLSVDVINKDILYYKEFFKKFLLKNLEGRCRIIGISMLHN